MALRGQARPQPPSPVKPEADFLSVQLGRWPALPAAENGPLAGLFEVLSPVVSRAPDCQALSPQSGSKAKLPNVSGQRGKGVGGQGHGGGGAGGPLRLHPDSPSWGGGQKAMLSAGLCTPPLSRPSPAFFLRVIPEQGFGADLNTRLVSTHVAFGVSSWGTSSVPLRSQRSPRPRGSAVGNPVESGLNPRRPPDPVHEMSGLSVKVCSPAPPAIGPC